MKVLRWINFILILAFLSACSSRTGGSGRLRYFRHIHSPLPTSQVRITPAPDARGGGNSIFKRFAKRRLRGMYAMLAKPSRDAITLEDFSKRWNTTLNEMSAASIEYTINSSQLGPDTTLKWHIALHTKLYWQAIFKETSSCVLSNEDSAWKVQWDDSLIMPELAGGNLLAMEYNIPARGDIYDREGLPIVSQADAFAFGIKPTRST